MKFIDIEQRLPEGRAFSVEPHRSSLIIHNDVLQVLGIISHGSMIRPTTAEQRDAWIMHLQGLEFNEPEYGKGLREHVLIHTGNPNTNE